MLSTTVLFIVLTLILTIVLAVGQQKSGLAFEKISLPQLAPAATVLILFLIYRNLPAAINFQFDKSILVKTALAFLLPAALFTLAFFIARQFHLDVKITANLKNLIPLMIAGMLVGAIGEETGWRSFLQPLLEKTHSVLLASVFVGIIWGLWHIGHYKNGFVYMTGFLLFTISASVIISWLLRGTDYSLIVSMIFHFAINLGFLLFFHHSMTNSKYMLINGLVWLIPALAIVLMTGKTLIRF